MGNGEQRVELPPRPTSAAEARRFVAKALRSVEPSVREVGVLLASELVTNALLYAQGRIVVRVTPVEHAWRVTVHDGSSTDIRPRQVGIEATSGRGLALVEQLSTSWGVDHDDGRGKEVWFEVPRT
ncbi:MAG: putative anti-sigma regulatory factor, serine/threonine protein kinase [Actinomycetia bacterium]|nr:putative anti-sigma regulatory factor, serine/threonine protein kinase [Actinomycetes bacterium]